MSETPYLELAQALDQLEARMIAEQLWSSQVPSAEALQSTKPFCVDTLSFEQWLQFIMLPTFRAMITQVLPLPTQCDIHSMATEMWKDRHLEVQLCIQSIDKIISGQVAS